MNRLVPPTILLLASCLAAQPGPPVALTFDGPGQGKTALAWSPDGDRIAYPYGRPWASWVATVPAIGGAWTVLTPPQVMPICGQTIHWSPDTQLIYFRQVNQFSIAPGEGVPSRIPSTGLNAPFPLSAVQTHELALSPNGRRLLYVFGDIFSASERGLGHIHLPSLTEQSLIPPANPGLWYIEFLPFGLFASFYDNALHRFQLLTPVGLRTVFAAPPACYGARLRWSPDAERLSMQSPCFNNNWDVRWVRPFDSTIRFLNMAAPAGSVYWSPAGTHVAFLTAGNVALVEVPSGRLVTVQAGGLAVSWISWSPFSDEIAWIGTPTPGGYPEIYKASTGLPPTPAVIGDLTPGSTNRVRLNVPADASFPYVLAASLGTTPGIPTPRGTIPLNPDGLFLVSQLPSSVFQRFQGFLGPTGRADATLAIPPGSALVGLRFFLGFVTWGPGPPGGLQTISAARPVFVQPVD